MQIVYRGIITIFVFQIIALDLSIYSISKAEHSQVCVDPDGCSTRPHIQILYPSQGSHLRMSECRVRFVVENAPAGSISRVFIGGTELEFFRDGKKSTSFASSYFDEAFTVNPGYWDVQVH